MPVRSRVCYGSQVVPRRDDRTGQEAVQGQCPVDYELALAGATKKSVTISPEGKVVSAKVVSAK